VVDQGPLHDLAQKDCLHHNAERRADPDSD
jgi:hypothetical protein